MNATRYIPAISKYRRTRGISGSWCLAGETRRDFSGAVVIPSLGEGDSLFSTLASLAQNPCEFLERFLVVVVVNEGEQTAAGFREQNRRDLARLASGDHPPGLRLAWVDAASTRERWLPPRHGGVGLARKIGLDLALPRLDLGGSFEPLLLCLDADTLVQPDYLPAVAHHFRTAPQGAAVLPFRHRPGASPAYERAIERYELFLRCYVLGLELAGSPYAFHTVGSTVACRAGAYVRAGGMNRRRAGEDFYFLQQLAKTSEVAALSGTVVHPSGRPTCRTPFGTGPSVSRQLAGDLRGVRLYDPGCFRVLGAWLELVTVRLECSSRELFCRARDISEELARFLEQEDFPHAWDRLQRNHPRSRTLLRAFHGWFDGLKSLRLIHHLSAGSLPRKEPEHAVPEYLGWAGLSPSGDGALEVLRRRQGAGADSVVAPAISSWPLSRVGL